MATARKPGTWRANVLIITLFFFSLPAYAKYSGGTGEPNDPYQIATAADLIALGETPEDYDKHFILTADIDLGPNLPGRKVFDRAVIAPDVNDGEDWFQGTPFFGVFDGDGHTISHATITGVDYLGLFGRLGSYQHRGVEGVEVRDLGVVNVNIVGSGERVGGLVAEVSYGSITGCFSSGSVSASGSALSGGGGGLVGKNLGRVANCYSTCSVVRDNTVGGLVGSNGRGSVEYCYSIGRVTGNSMVGGLIGSNRLYGPGYYFGTVSCSFWDMRTSGRETSDGGTGLTTAEMRTAGTFLAWGGRGSYWTIDEGRDYPHLAWEDVSGEVIAGPTYGGGTGTVETPYLIYTAEQLNMIGLVPYHWDKYFKLMADIDLSVYDGKDGRLPFNMIAPHREQETPCSYTGVFDGNGYIISHLTISVEEYAGLFGGLSGEVRNLELADVNATQSSGHYCVGALTAFNEGKVTECCGNGIVTGAYCVGGLVGLNYGETIGCYFAGAISGGFDAGGLVGANAEGAVLNQCHSACAVSGDSGVGGLVGNNYEGSISLSYSSSEVDGNSQVGGLVGINYGSIIASCSSGSVNGNHRVGGLVGFSHYGVLTQSYSTSDVTGDWSVGGLVGDSSSGSIAICYSTGAVTGDGNDVGGLVGDNYGDVVACFWDTETSGQGKSAAGTGKTTSEMQDIQTYLNAGWDFVDERGNGLHEFWLIPEEGGYPILANFNGYTPSKLHGLGTPENPYLISSDVELGAIIYYSPFAYYRLTSSIDLSGIRWNTSVIPWFEGSFDGKSRTISHLTISGIRCLGLFGQLGEGADVRDLGVVDANVVGLYDFGALAGVNSGIVTGCHSTGSVSEIDWLGSGSGIGGLIGDNNGQVTNCYSTCTVTGMDSGIGGLLGVNDYDGIVTACYSTGKVVGFQNVGGLVGYNYRGSITMSYSNGSVSGHWIGGLVGWIWWGNVNQCYSTCVVSGTGSAGGLVGYNHGAVVTTSFWDIQTSGQFTSDGGTGKTTANMQKASTFLNAGWDFVDETANGTEDIWWILEGKDYPRLWWELLK